MDDYILDRRDHKMVKKLQRYLVENNHYFLVAIGTEEQMDAWRQGKLYFDISQKKLIAADKAAKKQDMEKNGFPTLLTWTEWSTLALHHVYRSCGDGELYELFDDDDELSEDALFELDGDMVATVLNRLSGMDLSYWENRYGSLSRWRKLVRETHKEKYGDEYDDEYDEDDE